MKGLLSGSGIGDIVPLADRMRYMQWLRTGLVVSVVMVWLFLTEHPQGGLDVLLWGTAAYIVVSMIGESLWRWQRTSGAYLFGILLIADGAYLAWAMHVTGGNASVVRYLILLHLIAVTLLASYRTGLKMALWHTLLLFLVHELRVAEVVATTPGQGSENIESLAAFAAVFWFVAFVTAAGSAGNERELRRRKVDLEALAAMAKELERWSMPSEVSQLLVTSLINTFGFERVVLVGGLGKLSLLAEHGAATSAVDKIERGSVLLEAASRRETLLVTGLDEAADPDLSAALPGARGLLVVPLIAEDRPIGVLVAEHGTRRRGARVQRRVVSTVERFVSHAAFALHNAWLVQKIQALALTDQLTQIPNRRALVERLDTELKYAIREGNTFAFVLIDIDNFKSFNDTYGHDMGDEVLRGVAAALRKECKQLDSVARYGGEEFAVVLSGCDLQQAKYAADRYRKAIETADLPVPVTGSAGVSVFPVHGTDIEPLVKAADDALYEAKAAGRNCVKVARDPTDEPPEPAPPIPSASGSG